MTEVREAKYQWGQPVTAAVDLFKLSTNNEKTFIQSLTMNIIPVWYWTDANDWCTAADPGDA